MKHPFDCGCKTCRTQRLLTCPCSRHQLERGEITEAEYLHRTTYDWADLEKQSDAARQRERDA